MLLLYTALGKNRGVGYVDRGLSTITITTTRYMLLILCYGSSLSLFASMDATIIYSAVARAKFLDQSHHRRYIPHIKVVLAYSLFPD